MIELQVELDFACCNCGAEVSVTLKCAGKGLTGGAHAVAQVKVPCPSCCGVNHLYFEPSGTVKAVRPCKPAGAIPELAGYRTIRREVRYGKNSRVDFLLGSPDRAPCYVEIKNVHLMRRPGLAEFPDAVTKRGAKHLVELSDMAGAGARAVMLFLVQIGSAQRFALARDIDPAYGRAYDAARAAGVETIARRCRLTQEGIEVAEPISIDEP